MTLLKDGVTTAPIETAYAGLAGQGFNGWSSSPSFGSNIWLNVVTTLLLGVGIGALAQPQLVVRFLSAKDDKALDRSMWIGALFVLVILGTAFTIGPLSNVYFQSNPLDLRTAISFANTDMIIPEFVNSLFGGIGGGDFFISLFVLALICAAISTMSALFHVMGSAAGYDIWTRRKNLREVASTTNMKGSMKANRVGTMIMVVVVVIVAYMMPANIIAKATVIFMGMTAATLLPTMAYGLYSKLKPNLNVAKISIAVGITSWSLWAFFVNKGIADVVKTPRLVGESWMIYVDPIVIGLPLSAIALVISYLILVRGKKNKEAAQQP
jgi:SSS family solute:Na+ symporter